MKGILHMFDSRSLKWRLVSRVSLLLVLLMLIINVGFILWIVLRTPNVNGADEGLESVIAESVVRTGHSLSVEPSEDLKQLRNEFPTLWFVVQQFDGSPARFGTVPEEYEQVISRLATLVSFSAIEFEGSPLTVKMATLNTRAGPAKVIYGGKSTPGPFLRNLIWVLKVLYLPTTIIPFLLIAVAIPIIVDRAFSGLERTSARAARIDLNSPDMRLPLDDVVRELDPLVHAINSALSRIEENIQLRQRFITDAAHELRTPIAILQTRLEALVEGEAKERLLLDVSRLGAVAEQLLDVQRFGALHSIENVNLVKVCETVAVDLAPIAIAAGYELEYCPAAGYIPIRADASSVERAVTNLVRNAVEHGGGRGRIVIEVTREGAVDVSDEGEGIAPKEREKIFEPFYRSKPRSTGAGLGLSLVRQIAQAHGGNVRVVPQVRGARFRLELQERPG